MAATNFDYTANSTYDNLTAFAGGGQANGTALKFGNNIVTTAATAADSLKLPVGNLFATQNVGADVRVFNQGAASATVYPQTGGVLGTAAVNAGVAIPSGKSATFTLLRQLTGADVWGVDVAA